MSNDDEVGSIRTWFIRTVKQTILFFLCTVAAFGVVTLAMYYSSEILSLSQYAAGMVKPPS